MKKISLIIIAVMFAVFSNMNGQSKCCKDSKDCFDKGEWRQGLKYQPHASVDKALFNAQYAKNKRLWDKAFDFLRQTNLDTISPGKYPIVGDSVFVSITFNPTKEIEKSKWEFHKKYIDLQMVISGKEKMGVVDFSKTSILDPYNETKDIGFAAYDQGDYYVAEAGVFFLFFPGQAHRPSLKVEGCDKDKKIVIKIAYAN
jgi:biofilm protein TabA